MSTDQEFDELARQKLEGRTFPFADADWQDARRRIDAARSKRRSRGAWGLGGGLLLLIGGLWWQGTPHASTEGPVAAHGPHAEAPPAPAIVPVADPAPVDARAPLAAPPPSPPAGMRVERAAVADEARPVASAPRPEARPLPEQPIAAHRSQADLAQPEPHDAARTVQHHARRLDAPQPPGNVAKSTPEPTVAQTAALHTEDGLPAGDQAASAPIPAAAVPATPQVLAAAITTALPPESVDPAVQAAYAPEASPADGAVPVQAPSAMPDTTAALAAAVLPTDSLLEPALPPAPMDSATAAAPALAPPLVPARAPWEISLAGGLFQGQGRYAGAQSADWAGDVSGARGAGAGVELMHMGRHIGLGLGLHYGIDAERIRTDAIDVHSIQTHTYWYLQPVDTVVLFITDTVPGQPPTYTGTSIDTTVHVLTQGLDTVVSVQHRRDARDQVNRVSYLEVPLLLDVHVTQGRWMLGLRGGPAIGLLTGRRGALPNGTGDGYVPLADQAFREWTLGYSARAYVRYRFNAAWSVGIEPAIRGQLMNSLNSEALERRSTAGGVMLSLTYRLR